MTASALRTELAQLAPVDVRSLTVHAMRLSLRTPHRASWGEVRGRDVAFVAIDTGETHGWSELATLDTPRYQPDWTTASTEVITGVLAPALVGRSITCFEANAEMSRQVAGNHPACAAVSDAVLDAQLRTAELSLGVLFGQVGPAWGITCEWQADALLETAIDAHKQGARRIKLKLGPADIDKPDALCRVLDELHGAAPGLLVALDANGKLTASPATTRVLTDLARRGVWAFEQPFHPQDWRAARDLVAAMAGSNTFVAADEAATSGEAIELLLEVGAATAACLKPGPLGGIAATIDAIDTCQQAGAAHWIGGLLESNVGRAPLAALAAVANQWPGDFGESARYYFDDRAEPTTIDSEGRLRLHTGVGIGPRPHMAL